MVEGSRAPFGVAVLVLVASCGRAPQTSPPVAPAQLVSAADSARCAAVADSLLALPPQELPLAKPVRDALPPRPRPPAGATAFVVQTMFVVRPDGTADTATVTILGTDDASYRRAMVRFLSRERFQVPIVNRCPTWGRGDISVMGVIETGPRRSP